MAYRTSEGIAAAIHHDGTFIPLRNVRPDLPVHWGTLIASLHGKDLTLPTSTIALVHKRVVPAMPANKIICVGLNYTDHAKEGNQPIPEHPVFFIRYHSSFVAHERSLIAPRNSNRYDYEAELAVIIGKTARHVPKEQALDYVFGYTCAMDGTMRDFQKRTPQWTQGKNFDNSGALGPDIVTPGELPPGARGLKIQSRLNGRLMQDGNTADMIFDVAAIISALSDTMTLSPGDVILTGTPAGVGFARTPPVYLKAGDTVEVFIEGIGTLINKVKAE